MSNLFPYQTNYSLGLLTINDTPLNRSSFLTEYSYEQDVYQFELGETNNLNIYLYNLNADDDSDLELYRDSNYNGELDESDQWLDESISIGDDVINYPEAFADTYFAVVSYYDGGEDKTIDYELEFELGSNLFLYQTNYSLGLLTDNNTPLSRTSVLLESSYEYDNYQFELNEIGSLNISLYNLDMENDADLKLYRDSNNNGELDYNDELLDDSTLIGDDFISYQEASANTYFAVVSYYDGGEDATINYKLDFAFFSKLMDWNLDDLSNIGDFDELDFNFDVLSQIIDSYLDDMSGIRDFDGLDLGASDAWQTIGFVDIQGDGDLEFVYVNPVIGRWATIGPDATGNVDFSNHGWGGDTRVVGIYLDPLIEAGIVEAGSPFDSQRRFQNDLYIDNLTLLHGDDYDGDGLQEVYFKVNDGTAVLHAYMHADGNIQYANYQSDSDLEQFMNDNGVDREIWSNWL